MTTPPTVSVIVPTYNRAKFVGEALSSVCAQSFTDFEVIVVDDGSTDDTEKVVASLGDPRIRYFWQRNSGLPAKSRNVGISMAQGRYIAFLDSDDLWLPEKLAVQVEFMEANPTVGLTCTNAEGFSDSGQAWRLNKIGLVPRHSMRDLLCGNFIATLTVMVRRDSLQAVGVFNVDPGLRGVEDYEQWLRIGASYPFRYLPLGTARYRVHEGNLMGIDYVLLLERTISMLRSLEKTLNVPAADFRRGLATHYRRLAQEYALSGSIDGYYRSLAASWKIGHEPKSYCLLLLSSLVGFKLSKSLIAVAKKIKYAADRTLWFAASGS